MAGHTIVLVSPYGEPDKETRSPKEYVGYMQYLFQVALDVKFLGEKVALLMHVSAESPTVESVFRNLLEELGAPIPPTYTEEESTSTPGGIFRGYSSLWNHWSTTREELHPSVPHDIRDCDILITCDKAREYKTTKLAPRLIRMVEGSKWRPDRCIEVIGRERPDINWKSNELFQWAETQYLLYAPAQFPHSLAKRL